MCLTHAEPTIFLTETEAMDKHFLSSEEYDEQAHQHYNEGRYDEALALLGEGLAIYPNAVDLHVGVGYARLAREEYGWAKRAFEESLVLDPDHEDGLAGLGETLLRFNQREGALRCFRKVLELGYEDDLDLMLQCGRALFREGLVAEAKEFFDVVAAQVPDSAEALALIGYCQHRLGEDDRAIASLRRALALDDDHFEARIYLANMLYDRSAFEDALGHLESTLPEEHWDELGIWRFIELSVTLRRVGEDDPGLKPWHDRLLELNGEPDAIDVMLDDIEQRATQAAERDARGQLELFGAMLADLATKAPPAQHQVTLTDGRTLEGTWEEIVQQMRGARGARGGRTLQEFMQTEARRASAQTGVSISANDAESFIRGSADAGILRILA
jgi:Flp pilus assembly protein TadD